MTKSRLKTVRLSERKVQEILGSNPGEGGADGYIYLITYRKKTSIRETKKKCVILRTFVMSSLCFVRIALDS